MAINKLLMFSIVYLVSIVIVDSGLPYVDGLRRLTNPSFYVEVILFPVKVQMAIAYEWWWYVSITLLHVLAVLSIVLCVIAFIREYARGHADGSVNLTGKAVACAVLMLDVLVLVSYGLIVVLYVMFIYPYEACVQAIRMLNLNE